MVAKTNRIGEENINTFGSKMIIIAFRRYKDIDVLFPEYNWVAKNYRYDNFKSGKIKCPLERRYYNKGYIGDGKYEVSINGNTTRVYDTWHRMLKRCFDEKTKENNLRTTMLLAKMNY